MCHANPTWGAPRIHGELLKLGIAIAEATVGHDMVRRRPPPSQTWRTFLTNHIGQLVSVDFFVVPTLTFRVLFVFVVLAHDRRQILHVNVTGYPTAAWTAQQIRNAVPWDTAPRFLLRDRDGTSGHNFRACLEAMEIDEVLTAPQSPWQNPYVDRLIGSMRRECVDHVIVLNERSLHRILRSYIDYYHLWRTHLSLGKDAPVSRRVEPAAPGEVMAIPHTWAACTTATIVTRPDDRHGRSPPEDRARRAAAGGASEGRQPLVDVHGVHGRDAHVAIVRRPHVRAIGHANRAYEVFRRYTIPAMLLARLAVDLTWQGRGLGKALVKDALLRTAAAADIAGIRALLVHAKDAEARGWYEALEFEPSPTDPYHLFLLMKDLRAMLSQ